MKVTAPCNSSITESDNLTLASCTVKYFDVINSRPVQHRVECTIVLNPNITSPVTSDCVDDIEQHRLRCEVAESLGEANKMADRGNFEGARGLLKKAAIRVKGSRVFRQLLAQHLLETLQESLEGIQDKVTYVQHGKSVMMNYCGSHWQQRSNTTPSQDGYVKRRKGPSPMGLLHALKPPPPTTTTASEGAQGRSQLLPCASSSTDSYNPYRNSHKMRMMTDYTKGKK